MELIEKRKKYRKTFITELEKDTGEYLAELDKFVATADGRYLVDEINAIFEIWIGDRFTKKFLLDFKEGRVEVDDIADPDGYIKLADFKEFMNFMKNKKFDKKYEKESPFSGNMEALKRLTEAKFPEFGGP